MQLEIRRAEDPPEGTLIFPAEGEPRDLVAGIAIRTMERGAFDGERVGAEAIGVIEEKHTQVHKRNRVTRPMRSKIRFECELKSSGGVERFLAVFERDALDLYLFREYCAFQAVGQDFYNVARFGKLSVISEQAHGFGLIAVYADAQFNDRLFALGDGLFHDD